MHTYIAHVGTYGNDNRPHALSARASGVAVEERFTDVGDGGARDEDVWVHRGAPGSPLSAGG